LITAIVISDDGAARVHLLLESLNVNSNNLFDITVLYKYSSENFFEGYSKAADYFYKKHKYGHAFPIKWVERTQSEISKDMIPCLETSRDLACLFNDENILFRRPPCYQSISRLFNEYNPLCLSLRLGNNTVIQNPYDRENYFAEIPANGEFVLDEFLIWDSSKITPYTNFAIPFSTNGHIYKKCNLKEIVELSSESESSKLEEELQPIIYQELYEKFPRLMASPEYSVVIHNSSKKISDTSRVDLGLRKEDINTRYLNGKKIDLDYFSFDAISKPYEDFVLRFI
jgi:hypothetical protein